MLKVCNAITAFMNKKVTAYGISVALLFDFILLLLMTLCVFMGAAVDKWLLLFIVTDTIWSYLSEKKKNNHYFYGE